MLPRFSDENPRNATKYNCIMSLNSRFSLASHFGQRNPAYTADSYRDSSRENAHERQASSSASITLDENLSRLFECMRLEYGT